MLAGSGYRGELIAALASSRLMGSLLFGTSPRDVDRVLLVPLLVLSVALSASYMPARRTVRIDPVDAVRYG